MSMFVMVAGIFSLVMSTSVFGLVLGAAALIVSVILKKKKADTLTPKDLSRIKIGQMAAFFGVTSSILLLIISLYAQNAAVAG